MQFNLLADGLGLEDFTASPPKSLEWESRKHQILLEMLRFPVDVYGLEEVNHFDDWIQPQMEQFGYTSRWKSKTKSPCLKFGAPPDGCAMLIHSAKFNIKKYEEFAFEVDGKPANQVAQLALLEWKNNEKKPCVCVAVTHLKSKESFEPVRLQQIANLNERIKDFLKDEGDVPVVLIGDLNTAQDGLVCDFIRDEMKLTSLYDLDGSKSEPKWTTWKIRKTAKCVTEDYIWFDASKMDVLWRLALPGDSSVGQERFPSWQFPSDHLNLAGELFLKE
jgi:nocturnin